MQKLNKIDNNLWLLPLGIYIVEYEALVISDIHIGFEKALSRSGIQMPSNSYDTMKGTIGEYLDITEAKTIVINGDLKEDIYRLSYQEHNEVDDLFDYLVSRGIDIKFVRGNHDNFMKSFFEDRKHIDVYEQYLELGDNFITHGHILLDEEMKSSKAKRVIIGHEHAGVVLKDEAGFNHKFKATCRANIYNKKLYVLPAFSPIKSSGELNGENKSILSPILKRAGNFIFYLFEDGDWFEFKDEQIL